MPTEFESGSREQLRWVEAGQHDTSSATDFVQIPHGGNPTGPDKQWNRGPTDEVSPDLTVNDNPITGFTVQVSFQNVIRYGIYDPMLRTVFANDWTAAFDTGVVDTLATVATGNKFQAGAGTPFAALAAQVPCPVWICRAGPTNEITGRPVVALAVLAAGAELQIATSTENGLTLTDVAAGDDVQIIHSGVLKNGTEHVYGILERAQTGLEHFHAGFGMIGTQCDFALAKGSVPTFSITLAGKDADDATATFGTGTVTPAPAWKSFDAGSGLKHFREGGTIVATLFPQAVNYSIQGSVAAIDPAGIDGPYAHEKNRFQVTGSVNYFSNDSARTISNKSKSNTPSKLMFANQKTNVDGTTNAYVHHFPAIDYQNAPQDGGGNDNPLMTNTSWMAKKDETIGYMFAIARFTDVPLTL